MKEQIKQWVEAMGGGNYPDDDGMNPCIHHQIGFRLTEDEARNKKLTMLAVTHLKSFCEIAEMNDGLQVLHEEFAVQFHTGDNPYHGDHTVAVITIKRISKQA